MKYNIPISWESYKRYKVEADSLEEATKKALKQFLTEPDENYLDDSFKVDVEVLKEDYPNENLDIDSIINNI